MGAGFWRDALERTVRTFAQSLAALLVASGAGLLDAPWQTSLSVAGMSAAVALLTAIGGATVGDPSSASVLPRRRGDTVP